jgi:hypothetical protein
MAEPARKFLDEIETLKAALSRLDDEGFKKEVAKLASKQSKNSELRDTIAKIAADEFGDAGKETVLRIWQEMAHTQVARARTTGLRDFQHSKSPLGIAQSLENAWVALERLNIDCRYDLFHDKIVVKGYQSGLRRGSALESLDNIALKVRQEVLNLALTQA